MVVGIIPARGGSRGIPRKNLATLAGKPLLVHTLEQARAVCLPTVVSTDDLEISKVAHFAGARVILRPENISGDYSQSDDAVLHVLDNLETKPDIICMLQCTSPIRRPSHIKEAIEMVHCGEYDSVLSAVRLHQFVWRDAGQGAYPLNYNPLGYRPMRQSVAEWVENGSIYVFRRQILEQYGSRLGGKIGIYEMPMWSRFEIDQKDDLDICEWIMSRENMV